MDGERKLSAVSELISVECWKDGMMPYISMFWLIRLFQTSKKADRWRLERYLSNRIKGKAETYSGLNVQ